MASPSIRVDLSKIRQNAAFLRKLCKTSSIELMAVTKGVLGSTEIVRVLAEAGIGTVGDARIENIEKIRTHFPDLKIAFLRNPTLAEVSRVVELADISFNTEIDTIKRLDAAARKLDKVHDVMLTVEVGDLREGIPPEKLSGILREIEVLRNVSLVGLACNFSCLSGSVVTEDVVKAAVLQIVEMLSQSPARVFSMGGSCVLPVLSEGLIPREVNQLRIGEAILLGRVPPIGLPVEGTHQDPFLIAAEVVEVAMKNVNGSGPLNRAVLAIGKQDIIVEGLSVSNGFKIAGASSDNLVIDLSDSQLKIGDEVIFHPSYECLVRAMTSPFVLKEYLN